MSVRISQIPLETLIQPETQRSRISQFPVEVLYTLSVVGSVRISQIPIEVLIGNVEVSTKKKYGPFVQCI